MNVLIAGVDGYLGWSLAMHLAKRGHRVSGIDAYYRRDWVQEMGSQSATPIRRMTERVEAFYENFGEPLEFIKGDLTDYGVVENAIRHIRPDAIVHLGEMPSAPYSMIDVRHATWTQTNNLVGTLNLLFAMRDHRPDCHLLKLGTMGEYGTPNLDIPEGFFEIEYRGRKDRVPFPRQAASWYHQSKVHDSNNVMMACKHWNLRSTDVMQGVVFGTRIEAMGEDPRLWTRLDFDQSFGTAINRFCCQSIIGEPLTLYGGGGRKRGFLTLQDSIQCMTLALEKPPEAGEYRVFNQFENVYDIAGLAGVVQRAGRAVGLDPQIRNLVNPRKEVEGHHYNPDRQNLLDLGYEPDTDMEGAVRSMLEDLRPFEIRIAAKKRALAPDICWDGRRQQLEEH